MASTKVKELLSLVKANSKTYYNQSQWDIDNFRKQYARIKKCQDCDVDSVAVQNVKKILKTHELDISKKLKAIDAIEWGIRIAKK